MSLLTQIRHVTGSVSGLHLTSQFSTSHMGRLLGTVVGREQTVRNEGNQSLFIFPLSYK